MSEKIQVAKTSAMASGMLTALKIGAGLLTGSLAMLSEGIHSSLDFLATMATWLSVHTADRPADESHHYGHGKIENLSAFAEGLLMMMTAAWILWESVQRLTHETVLLNERYWPWAVGVACLSLVVDASRASALWRAAKKHKSHALEADAMHFAVELISTLFVLLGLLAVRFGGERWERADALAAMGVAGIMAIIAVNLVKRSADELMDRAPEGLEREMQELIRRVPGVYDVPRIRARQSGASTFVDATIRVNPDATLEAGHQVASSVEHVVTERHPGLDITVHVEPADRAESHADAIYALADAMQLKIHALRIREIHNQIFVNFHLEMPPETTLAQAHQVATDLEERIRLRLPGVAEIDSHVEPRQ